MKEPEYITKDQLEDLARHTDSPTERLFIRTLFYTGARVSEILALTTNDVHMDTKTLDIPHLKKRKPKPAFIFQDSHDGQITRRSANTEADARTRLPEGGAHWTLTREVHPTADDLSPRRRIPIADAILEDVSKLLASRIAQDAEAGQSATDARRLFHFSRMTAHRMLREASLRANIRTQGGRLVHPHALRHSFAIHWTQRGGDHKKLQKFLGHSDAKTTDIYLRFAPKDLGEELERIF
jgi:integrase